MLNLKGPLAMNQAAPELQMKSRTFMHLGMRLCSEDGDEKLRTL
jgi:hypothetical protein